MRILVAQPGPEFSVQDVYSGWVEALRALGQQVIEFNLSDRLTFYDRTFIQVSDHEFRKALDHEKAIDVAINGLYAALYKTRPHVLLVVSGFFVPHELLDLARASGTKVVILHTESPYEDERQALLASHADLNLLNDPTNIDTFRAIARTEYMPHAYRPVLHRPMPPIPERVSEFVFVGTGYPSRVQFLEAMNLDGIDVALAGNWQQLTDDSPLHKYLAHEPDHCLDNQDAVELYQASKVGLNLYRREAQRPDLTSGWAMGPREVELAACGLFFLRDPRPEGDEVLHMLPTVTSPAEAGEQLRWWLAHDKERDRLAGMARAAIADRTFDNNAAVLMRLLETEMR